MTNLTVTAVVTDRSGNTASATATATIGVDRSTLVSGVDKPTPSTTGLLTGVTRRTASASEIVAGATITDADIPFKVVSPTVPAGMTKAAATITFKNCWFKGPGTTPTGSEGLLTVTSGTACPVVATDCLFRPQLPHWFRMGIQGHDYTAIRCEFSYCQDGVEVFNTSDPNGPTNVILRQNWMHDFAYWQTGATLPSDGSHDDCVQIEGGTGTIIEGNWFQGYIAPDSPSPLNTYGTNHIGQCFMVKPDVGNIGALQVNKNWIEGGASGVNVRTYDRDPNTNAVLRSITPSFGTLQGNRFTKGSFRLSATSAILWPMVKDANGVWQNQVSADFGTGSTANIWDDGSGVVALTNGGAA
jgi:hypothetical protein